MVNTGEIHQNDTAFILTKLNYNPLCEAHKSSVGVGEVSQRSSGSGDDYRVYDSRCPHQVTNIPHLALSGKRLTCPKHQWAFDITTGECVDKGTRPLRQFDSRVTEGRLEAIW